MLSWLIENFDFYLELPLKLDEKIEQYFNEKVNVESKMLKKTRRFS